MLAYKLALEGIRLEVISEAYSSQTSPLAPDVSRKHAKKSNRVERGLYIDDGLAWNADCVGAFNILRLYLKQKEIDLTFDAKSISHPYILKAAASKTVVVVWTHPESTESRLRTSDAR